MRALGRIGGGISHPCGRAWPSAAIEELVPITVILPFFVSGGVRIGSGGGDVRASPRV